VKHRETINSRTLARDAFAQCTGAGRTAAFFHTFPHVGWVHVRPCDVRGEPSGGWNIRARAQCAPGLSGPYRTREYRVPGPVTVDKLARYLGTAEMQLRADRNIYAAREELDRFLATREVPADVTDIAIRLGVPVDYHAMTPGDCCAWRAEAKKWPLATTEGIK
jgi:hypothetical protein